MTNHRPIVRQLKFTILLLSLVSLGNRLFAQDGKALFQTNCASCHSPIKQIIGPALQGVTTRVTDQKLLYDWIHNNTKVLASGNKYFTDLYNQFNKTPMNTFPNLSDADIKAILGYVETYKAPVATTTGGSEPGSAGAKAEESDNTLLYGILTLILAIIMFVLLQVNSSLKKMSDDKEGIPASEPVPFYRNKVYIALVVLVLFVLGGYWVVQGAIGIGRQQGYQPEQPIFYSHKVHAGINQISCLYCHSNALDSRHATVPPLNVCMNCHAAINDYTKGPKLFREDGSEVDGTAEIQKLYSYTGYDPKAQKYDLAKAKPVEWIKIHNLPDHVFFSHAQHTKAGQVQCQTCHGPITEMDEVKQFAPLSMGWCINCHRTTKVNFPDSAGNNGNKFYSIYDRFHKDLKSGKMDSVTVENIGGTECQKCHY
ncbi:MAG TPA: c-type cytochrome [Puia sp.]|uniref:c-type cytochrome n=1 Tax=Puia sp. TaxID=2045100 RepID=UPI002B81F231|nr:c-type cytochrome [Puia sp.]HVU97150.1 c-type cytochrome [Puia sp.]